MDGNNQNGQNNGQYSNYQDNTANVPYQAPPDYMGGSNGTNGLQIAGLVCGILGIVTSCCYGVPGIILGIAGLICAIIGNNRGKTGVGTAALVCSIVSIVVGIGALIYYIWAIAYLDQIGYLDMILQGM